jgi:hypothetical protein
MYIASKNRELQKVGTLNNVITCIHLGFVSNLNGFKDRKKFLLNNSGPDISFPPPIILVARLLLLFHSLDHGLPRSPRMVLKIQPR